MPTYEMPGYKEPLKDPIGQINQSPTGEIVNHATVHKVGDELFTSRKVDFNSTDSKTVDGDTMFAEGSIGKVRWAGLAFLMQQEGIIDLTDNAHAFFSDPKIATYLERKYPGQGEKLQKQILTHFTGGDSDKATLADLTTHYAGVGDLTRDQLNMVRRKGLTTEYKLPDLLLTSPEDRTIPRDGGKPRAQSDAKVKDEDLPKAEYGAHQYSNTGYMLLGLALEAAYAKEKGVDKTYDQLMNDFILHPIEGRAAGKDRSFDHTKFGPTMAEETAGVIPGHFIDGDGKQIKVNNFSAANAGGSFFTSANDAERFFKSFFLGFPETEGYSADKAATNPFFSKETIALMEEEWKKHPNCGIDNEGHRYQGPGFVVTTDKPYFEKDGDPTSKAIKDVKILKYDKVGETPGYLSMMKFYPESSTVDISLIARENISGKVAKEAGVNLAHLLSAYKDKDSRYDRKAMLNDYKDGKGIEVVKKRVVKDVISKQAKAKVVRKVANETLDAILHSAEFKDAATKLKKTGAKFDETTSGVGVIPAGPTNRTTHGR